jgi:hypothetical protein
LAQTSFSRRQERTRHRYLFVLRYFPGSVVDIKDEGEESAETYKNSLLQELAEAIRREEEKSD